MEGVKILSEEMIKNFGGDTLFPFLILLGAVVLVFGICLISYYGHVEVESLIEILIGVTILMASIIGSVGNTYYEKNIKVLNEIIDFAKEHELDIDSAYIVWKGLDSLENVENFLKTINK